MLKDLLDAFFVKLGQMIADVLNELIKIILVPKNWLVIIPIILLIWLSTQV